MIYNNEVKDTGNKKIFSWEESVRRYPEVYQEIIGG